MCQFVLARTGRVYIRTTEIRGAGEIEVRTDLRRRRAEGLSERTRIIAKPSSYEMVIHALWTWRSAQVEIQM